MMHCVNCWDALKPSHHNVAGNGKRDGLKSERMSQWVISSQASEQSVEGSTNRSNSLSETMKAHERTAPPRGEDIFWSAVKAAEADHKQISDNSPRWAIGERSNLRRTCASRMAVLRWYERPSKLSGSGQSTVLHPHSRRQTAIYCSLLVLPSRRRYPRFRLDDGCLQQWPTTAVSHHAFGQADHSASSPELQRQRRVLQCRHHVGTGSTQHRRNR